MPTRFLHDCRRTAARNPPAPDVRSHATWPQSWIQREHWEFETHRLFTLLAERDERRAMMVTSNLVFSQWDRIFRDQMATAAAIDRLVHHAVVLEFDVPSFRTDPSRPTSPPSPPPVPRGRPPGPLLPLRRRPASS